MGCSSHFSLLQEVVQSLREACSKEMGITADFNITGLINVSIENLSTASFIISERAKPSKEKAAELFWDGSSFHAVSSLSFAVPNSKHEMCECRCCICVHKDRHQTWAPASTVLNIESGWSQVSVHETHSDAYPAPGGGPKTVRGSLQTAQPLLEESHPVLQRENSTYHDTGKHDGLGNEHSKLPERCHSIHAIVVSKNSAHTDLDKQDGSVDQHFTTSDSMDCEENGNEGALVIDMNSSCEDTVLYHEDQTVKNHVDVNERSSYVDMPVSAAEKNFTHVFVRSRKSKSSVSKVEAPYETDTMHCWPESKGNYPGDAGLGVHATESMSIANQSSQDQSSQVCESKQSVLVKTEPDDDGDREDWCSSNHAEQEAYDGNGINIAQIKVEPADSPEHIAIPFEESRFSDIQASETQEHGFGFSALPKQESVCFSTASSTHMEQNLARPVLSKELHLTIHARQADVPGTSSALSDATERPQTLSRDGFHGWGTDDSTFPVISSTVSLAGLVTSQKEWDDQWSQSTDNQLSQVTDDKWSQSTDNQLSQVTDDKWSQTTDNQWLKFSNAQSSSSQSFDRAGRELHLDEVQATPRPVMPVIVASSSCFKERKCLESSKMPSGVTRYKEIRPKWTLPDIATNLQHRSLRHRRLKHLSSRQKQSKQTSSQSCFLPFSTFTVPVSQFSHRGEAQMGASENPLQGTLGTNILVANAHSSPAESLADAANQSPHIVGILSPHAHPFSVGGGIQNQTTEKINTEAHSVDNLVLSSEKVPNAVYLVNGTPSYPAQSVTSSRQIQIRHLNFGNMELLPLASDGNRTETQQNYGVTLSSSKGKNAEESCGKKLILKSSELEKLKKLKPILPKQTF